MTVAPDAWARSKLGALITPSKEKVDPKKFGDLPYVGLEHVEAHTMRLLGHGRGGDVTSTKATFLKGDVLYGRLRPYLNKVVQPDFDGICSTDFLVFRDSEALDLEYLAQYLNQSWVADAATQASRGVQLPRVDWRFLADLPVTYPRDKAEQHALATFLQGLRDRQAQARQHLESGTRALVTFRQSLLAAACSGELTADWRASHPEVDAGSLTSDLALRKANSSPHRTRTVTRIAELDLPEVPPSWSWMSVDSISHAVVDGVHKTPDYVDSGVPFVTVRNLTAGPSIDFERVKYISQDDHRAFTARTRPERGDILVSKDGTLGVVRQIDTDREFSIFVSVAMVKPLMYEMSDYLVIALSSPQVQRQMVGVGSGLVHLVLRDLKADGLPVPPLEEQLQIVNRVKALMQLADAVTEHIKKLSSNVERTAFAVLSAATRGAPTISPDGKH